MILAHVKASLAQLACVNLAAQSHSDLILASIVCKHASHCPCQPQVCHHVPSSSALEVAASHQLYAIQLFASSSNADPPEHTWLLPLSLPASAVFVYLW